MLPIYFLLRGRTPEALHAYAAHCPRTPTTQQQLDLAALLSEAARTLPAPQRALIVQRGAASALAPAGGSSGGAAGVALTAGLPALAGDVAPALLSLGPSPAQAPLVGSIPVMMEQQRLATAAAASAAAAAARAAAEAACGGQQQAQAMLFGQQSGAAGARGGAAATPPSAFFGSQAGASAAAGVGEGGEELPAFAVAAASGVPGHEFDRMVGLSPFPAAAAGHTPGGGGAKGKRRWGGSAYR